MSVLFAEVVSPPGRDRADPEELHEMVGEQLARVIAEVEGLGGTVTSVSGAGLQALFGAPEAHEDDPERAVRAALRALSAPAPGGGQATPALRMGIETGPAVVGPIGAGPLRVRGRGSRGTGRCLPPVAGQSGRRPGGTGHAGRHGRALRVGPGRGAGPGHAGGAAGRFLRGEAQAGGTGPAAQEGGPGPWRAAPPSLPASTMRCGRRKEGTVRSWSW